MLDIRAAGEVLAPLARRCGSDVERFRTEISLGAETDALDPRAEAITLLTLHGAKGLEFDVVFLAGCERGLLPLRRPGSGPLTPAEAAEERRLLFVGMTRARGRLVLTCAARRTRHGSEETAGRSPFLASVNSGSARPGRPPGRAGPVTASCACSEPVRCPAPPRSVLLDTRRPPASGLRWLSWLPTAMRPSACSSCAASQCATWPGRPTR